MKKVVITVVNSDSIAEKSGFKVGDIILKIGDEIVESLEQCRGIIRSIKNSDGVIDFLLQNSETLELKEIKISFESLEDKNLGITFIEQNLSQQKEEKRFTNIKNPPVDENGNTFINHTLQIFSIVVFIFSILGFLGALIAENIPNKMETGFGILFQGIIISILLFAISIIIRELRKLNINITNKKD
ncbi:PDZ domain-containing protein [bacterium]|nr:PDZ domain-containing protein [bacterium]